MDRRNLRVGDWVLFPPQLQPGTPVVPDGTIGQVRDIWPADQTCTVELLRAPGDVHKESKLVTVTMNRVYLVIGDTEHLFPYPIGSKVRVVDPGSMFHGNEGEVTSFYGYGPDPTYPSRFVQLSPTLTKSFQIDQLEMQPRFRYGELVKVIGAAHPNLAGRRGGVLSGGTVAVSWRGTAAMEQVWVYEVRLNEVGAKPACVHRFLESELEHDGPYFQEMMTGRLSARDLEFEDCRPLPKLDYQPEAEQSRFAVGDTVQVVAGADLGLYAGVITGLDQIDTSTGSQVSHFVAYRVEFLWDDQGARLDSPIHKNLLMEAWLRHAILQRPPGVLHVTVTNEDSSDFAEVGQQLSGRKQQKDGTYLLTTPVVRKQPGPTRVTKEDLLEVLAVLELSKEQEQTYRSKTLVTLQSLGSAAFHALSALTRELEQVVHDLTLTREATQNVRRHTIGIGSKVYATLLPALRDRLGTVLSIAPDNSVMVQYDVKERDPRLPAWVELVHAEHLRLATPEEIANDGK